MSVLHPIASKIATAKILCWGQIPGEVGFALVSATWDDHLSRREVSKATFVELRAELREQQIKKSRLKSGAKVIQGAQILERSPQASEGQRQYRYFSIQVHARRECSDLGTSYDTDNHRDAPASKRSF
jgi:hypothetical protein